MIQRANYRGNVYNTAAFQQVQVHLIPQLPVGGYRFVLLGNMLECFFRLFLTDNTSYSKAFSLVYWYHNRHIRYLKVNHIVEYIVSLKRFFFNGSNLSNALQWIYHMLVNFKFW